MKLPSSGISELDMTTTTSTLMLVSGIYNHIIQTENDVHPAIFLGSILVAVNPYRMFDIYGLDAVSSYDGRILGNLPPHLFAIGAAAYNRLVTKTGENQVILFSGESGAGKSESTKLLTQYFAAINKSVSNLITEQILEAAPIMESFGNAKSIRNDNSSRFGKYIEILYRVSSYLLL